MRQHGSQATVGKMKYLLSKYEIQWITKCHTICTTKTYSTIQYNHCIQCRSVPVQMDFFSLAVIDVTSFWQTLQMKRVWLVFLTQVTSKLQRVQIYTSVWCSCLMDSSYLQNLPSHLRYHRLLWLWCQSLFDSCAHPSVWSWYTSAPLLWSPHRHLCRTERQEKNSNRVCKNRDEDEEEDLILTSLKASLSSFMPIMPAVSSNSFGVMRSTKSSKSTLPPTGVKNEKMKKRKLHLPKMKS